jgi:anthranilate phosphoribosyltransferase
MPRLYDSSVAATSLLPAVKELPVAQPVCLQILEGHDLSLPQMADVMDQIMRGSWSEDEIVQFLTVLNQKGEAVEELAGAAAALRKHMTPIRSHHERLVDTCGTGGDASGTFNISTAAALVTAAAGVPVAKHGNRGITSRSGSADVLAALGVDIEAPVVVVERCLDELGIGFCFAPQLHPSMRHVAAARKRMGTPTIFNLLGPLCNPASAPFQLLGVGRPHLRQHIASALALLGTRRALVVTGEDGLDEVTLSGATHVIEIRADEHHTWDWQPNDFGVPASDRQCLLIDGPADSARLIRSVLDGAAGPPRDIVLVNAAAALWTSGENESLPACVQQAAAAIDSGAAKKLLARLATLSHRR